MKDISVHAHIFYEDAGIYLLNKLAKLWSGKVYLSLIKDNCANEVFLSLAHTLFSSVDYVLVENKGTDQYGFIKSFQQNKEQTKWILYWHDKHISKQKWFDDLTDIFLDENNNKVLQRYTGNISSCGIVSSSKHKTVTSSLVDLASIGHNIGIDNRQKLVRSFHTLFWLKELQFLFKLNYNIYNEEHAFPMFTAGNVFLIRREILTKVHNIIHDNYFENFYREDGDVGHALERFYYYASSCLGYQNRFL